jgi:hypothetical protein
MVKKGEKMENKLFILFVLIFAIAILTNSKFILADNLCNPNIKIVNQDPDPAVPGDYVKVLFEISGLYDCNGFVVKLNPEYPFSLDPGVNPIQTLAGTPNVQNYKAIWDVPYKLRVADDALESDYPITLTSHIGSGQDFGSNSVDTILNVSIVDSQTDFDVVVQDSSGTQASFGIVNIGKNTANSLVIKIPQQTAFRTTGVSEQIIGNLASGDYTIVNFNIVQSITRNFTGDMNFTRGTNNSIGQQPNGQQTLQIEIDYTDGIGKRRSVIKNVQFVASSSSGNFTRIGQITRNGTSSSSGGSLLKYLIGIIIIGGVILIIRNKDKLAGFYKENRNEKKSGNDPDWVSTERAQRKK